jgi:hypothetical protein
MTLTHLTCLGHLGWCDINRNDPISFAMPKVAKASTMVAVTCCCHQRYHLKYNANVNYPLGSIPILRGQGKYCTGTFSGVLAMILANVEGPLEIFY